MLDLPYHPDVPGAVIDLVEHHGRRLGVPLAAIESIGQSLDVAEAFILAAEAGRGVEFTDCLASGTPFLPAPLVAFAVSRKAAI